MELERYALIQRLLHWLIAVLVLGALAAGTLLDELPDGDLKNQLYALHKATGITILGLMLFRVLARLLYGAPPLPDAVPGWQRLAAGAVHLALYGLLIAMALIGWAATSAFPAPIPFFGLFEMPKIVGPDREFSKQLFELHETIGYAIMALIVLHLGAAILHGVIKKDGIVRRMWF